MNIEVNKRIMSSVTSGTDSSPVCVGSVAENDCFESPTGKLEGRISESGSLVGRDLQSSFNLVADTSEAVMHDTPFESAQKEEQEACNHAYPVDDRGENHEVELKDFVGLFGRADADSKGSDFPADHSKRGMKDKFKSQMKLNPKLKNLMKSTLTIVKDMKTGAELNCGESVEASLNKSGREIIDTSESNERKLNSKRSEADDEPEPKGNKGCDSSATGDNITGEIIFNEEGASVHGNVLPSAMSTDPPVSKSGVDEGIRVKKFMPRVKMNPKLKSFISSKVLDSKCEGSVELSLERTQQSDTSCTDAIDVGNILISAGSSGNDLSTSNKDVQPIIGCVSDMSKEDNVPITKEDGIKFNVVDPDGNIAAAYSYQDEDVKVTGASKENLEATGNGHDAGETKAAENVTPSKEVGEEQNVQHHESRSRSLKAQSWSEHDSGERDATKGMKRLISRVRSTQKIRSFLSSKSFEPKQENGEIESPRVTDVNVIVNVQDDHGLAASKSEGSASKPKAGMSSLGDISVFGGTKNESKSLSKTSSVNTAEEQEEKPIEFLQMKVTLKFKALAGISQVSSQSKADSQNATNGNVKAAVTYRRNTVASDRFVSTHVPSLPILLEQTPGLTNSQIYAQWPGWQQKDDESTASGMMMSSVTFTRTVRRVRNFDNVSSGGTAGGSKAKEPTGKEGKQFLASLSKAFAPELVDVQVGLMRSNEIIPLGIATIVIPGEYKSMQLDIPVVRNYAVSKKRGVNMNISQFSGKAKSPQDYAFFSANNETRYKINDGAFLRLELNIEPAESSPALSVPHRHLNANTHKAQFRSGPINIALRRRRKMDYLMSLKKLPLHQRVQLYLELRSRKAGNTNKALPNSHEVFLSRQSEVSEVSCEVQAQNIEEDNTSAKSLMDQYDLRHWSSGLDTVAEELSKGGDSYLGSNAPAASAITANTDKQDEAPSVASKHSNASDDLSTKMKETFSVATSHTNIASQHSNGTADTSNPQEKSALLTSVASFLVNDETGRQSPVSQDSDHDDELSHFSSSLHSVFTTNHPQKRDIADSMINLMGCDPYLATCEEERNALKYYAHENEDMNCAHYCVPALQEEYSVPDTDADDDTMVSLESVPVKVHRRSDPFLVDG